MMTSPDYVLFIACIAACEKVSCHATTWP